MLALSSPAAGAASGIAQVAGTALLVAGLCWSLRELDGYSRRPANASAAAVAWGLMGTYDRSPDLAAGETFKASCERKLKAVVEKLGDTIGRGERGELLQQIARSVDASAAQARRVQGAFRGGPYLYEFGCTQTPGQPVLGVVTRSPV